MGFLKYIKILYILKYLLVSHIHKDDKGHKNLILVINLNFVFGCYVLVLFSARTITHKCL